MTLGI